MKQHRSVQKPFRIIKVRAGIKEQEENGVFTESEAAMTQETLGR